MQIQRIFKDKSKLATAVFTAESHLRCDAVGDKDLEFVQNGITYGASYGVAQIRYLPGRPTPKQLMNCTFNIQYAKQILDRQGHFGSWSAYSNGKYKIYIQ